MDIENSDFVRWLFSQERRGYCPTIWTLALAHFALWLAVVLLFATGFHIAGYIFFSLVCLLSLKVLSSQTEEITRLWPAVIMAGLCMLIISVYSLAIVVLQKQFPVVF